MTEATHEAPPATPLNGLMLMAAMVSAISGALYGYDTGITSGALLVISKEFRSAPLPGCAETGLSVARASCTATSRVRRTWEVTPSIQKMWRSWKATVCVLR